MQLTTKLISMTTTLPTEQVPIYYRNALEPLVTKEVMRQLKQMPPKLAKYLNPAQIVAYALNRLPALYATSIEGWIRQQQKAEKELSAQIVLAVRQGCAAVQRDPLKCSTPLIKDEDVEL